MLRKSDIHHKTLFTPYGFMPLNEEHLYVNGSTLEINLDDSGYLTRKSDRGKTLLRDVPDDYEITEIEIDAGGCQYLTLPLKLCPFHDKLGLMIQINCVLHVDETEHGKVVNKYLGLSTLEQEPTGQERRYFVVNEDPSGTTTYGEIASDGLVM